MLAAGSPIWSVATSGAFAASEYNNNKFFVNPEWKLVIVRLGLDGGETDIIDTLWCRILELVGNALMDRPTN